MKLNKLLFIVLVLMMYYPVYGSDNLKRAIELFEAKKYNEAKGLLEKIVDADEKNATAFFYLGRVYFSLGDYDEAEDNFKEAIDLNENSADYRYWLANAYGMDATKSNVFSQALMAPKIKNNYLAALQLDPKHVKARIGLATFYLLAPGIVGGDINKAREQANKVVSIDEKRGRLLLARIYYKEKNLTKTESEFKTIEEKFGDDPEIYEFYNFYGYFLLEQKRYNEAIDKFKKQVKLAPNKPNPHDSLGDAYRTAGRINEAKDEYKKALEIDPSYTTSKEKLDELNKK